MSILQKEVETGLKNKSIILVDVRTEEEYKTGKIPGSVNIPLQDIETLFSKKFPNKDKKYVLYCRSGSRSRTAMIYLKLKGYKDVLNFGGISKWSGKLE